MTNTQSVEVYQALWPIALGILTFLTGVISTLFTLLYKNSKEKQREQDATIKEIQNSIMQMPEKYITKDDFARIITPLEKKVDDINEKLIELSKNLIKAIGELGIQIAKLKKGGDSSE